MAIHILQIAYYPGLLEARRIMLEQNGYHVTSALGNDQGISLAGKSSFDVIVVGFSAEEVLRQKMVSWIKHNVPRTPVVALQAHEGEHFPDADCETLCENPQVWLDAVANCIKRP